MKQDHTHCDKCGSVMPWSVTFVGPCPNGCNNAEQKLRDEIRELRGRLGLAKAELNSITGKVEPD